MLSPRYPAAVVAGNVETSQSGDGLSVRRAARARLRAGHDEQSDVRRRALSVLRDDLLRRAGRPRLFRRERRAYAHDQLAPDRPGGAGEPLSRGAGGFPRPPRLRRQGAIGAPATARCGASGSASRWIWRSSAGAGGWRVLASTAARPANSGATRVYRKDGEQEELPGCAQTALEAGEAIEIVTPTGGGWGAPS